MFDQVQLAGASKWGSPTGGVAYALQGPDAQAVATPEAPSAGSTELSAEMAEFYQMVLLWDAPVAALMAPASVAGLSNAFAADQGIACYGSHNRAPFAVFGGLHLLMMLTDVYALALRAVRFQKFSVHRRLRPEGMGARYHTAAGL
ncbi:MAG: hypothetical protein ACU0BB_17660 [Paracoccaceae bacterium]